MFRFQVVWKGCTGGTCACEPMVAGWSWCSSRELTQRFSTPAAFDLRPAIVSWGKKCADLAPSLCLFKIFQDVQGRCDSMGTCHIHSNCAKHRYTIVYYGQLLHILKSLFFEIHHNFWRTVLQELLDDHAWTPKLEGLFCDALSVFLAVTAEVQQV